MTPEELPDYAGLTTCRVIDYIPEWRRKEAEAAPQRKAPVQKEAPNIPKPVSYTHLTSGVAAAFPFASYELSDRNGIFLGLNMYNRSPVFLNPYDD